MRKLGLHLFGATLVLGLSTALAGCVIEARGEAQVGGGAAPHHATPKPKPKPTAHAATPNPKPAPVATSKPAPAQTQTAPQTTFTTDSNGALRLPGPVLFETGSDVLKAESDPVLTVVKDYLVAKPQITLLRIEGHTDNVGVAADNQKLSERRSLSVARWLISHGIKCSRLVPVGFGDRKPIADNSTPAGREQNRRTVFINAELNNKAIGGFPVDGGGTVSGDPCK